MAKKKKAKPPRTTGGIHGPGPQNLGRGNWLQGVEIGPDGKPRTTAAYNALPTPQALPPDYQQQATDLANTRQLQVGGAYGLYQKGNLGYDTGYNAAGARDYSNPYSQAALLDESYKRSKRGTEFGMANQGQLYAGANSIVAQGENDRNYSIGSNDLQTGAARGYQGIDWQRAQNYAQYGSGKDSSAFDAILRALGAK